MRPTFEPALKFLLVHEGGWSNDRMDPGGMTMLGVTKRAWEKYVGHTVDENEMRALTDERVAPFYKTEYWDMIQGDDLPAGLDYAVFDTCVNSGPGRAAKILQGVLGLVQDGVIGAMTLQATRIRPPHDTIIAFCASHLAFLKTLPGWNHDGKGWETRAGQVQIEALSLMTHTIEPLIS